MKNRQFLGRKWLIAAFLTIPGINANAQLGVIDFTENSVETEYRTLLEECVGPLGCYLNPITRAVEFWLDNSKTVNGYKSMLPDTFTQENITLSDKINVNLDVYDEIKIYQDCSKVANYYDQANKDLVLSKDVNYIYCGGDDGQIQVTRKTVSTPLIRESPLLPDQEISNSKFLSLYPPTLSGETVVYDARLYNYGYKRPKVPYYTQEWVPILADGLPIFLSLSIPHTWPWFPRILDPLVVTDMNSFSAPVVNLATVKVGCRSYSMETNLISDTGGIYAAHKEFKDNAQSKSLTKLKSECGHEISVELVKVQTVSDIPDNMILNVSLVTAADETKVWESYANLILEKLTETKNNYAGLSAANVEIQGSTKSIIDHMKSYTDELLFYLEGWSGVNNITIDLTELVYQGGELNGILMLAVDKTVTAPDFWVSFVGSDLLYGEYQQMITNLNIARLNPAAFQSLVDRAEEKLGNETRKANYFLNDMVSAAKVNIQSAIDAIAVEIRSLLNGA